MTCHDTIINIAIFIFIIFIVIYSLLYSYSCLQFGELIEHHITNGTIVPVEITCSLLERAMTQVRTTIRSLSLTELFI